MSMEEEWVLSGQKCNREGIPLKPSLAGMTSFPSIATQPPEGIPSRPRPIETQRLPGDSPHLITRLWNPAGYMRNVVERVQIEGEKLHLKTDDFRRAMKEMRGFGDDGRIIGFYA